jgi:hypothetical protein
VFVLYRREFHSDVLDVMVYTPTDTPPPEAVKEAAYVRTRVQHGDLKQ